MAATTSGDNDTADRATLPASSVFLDNLTIQGALRLLAAVKGARPSYRDDPGSITRARKWDYELNDGFRVAVDVACLSQLVQSMVLYEHVIVDGFYADSWRSPGVPPGGAQEPARAPLVADLDRVVVRHRLPHRLRLQQAGNASRRVLEYAQSDAFKDYLLLLATASLDAPFIQISNGYFLTGYSDPVLFPPAEHWELEDQLAPDDLADSVAAYNAIVEFDRTVADVSGLRSAGVHVLSRTPSDDDVHEKALAAADVMRNARAALYYQGLADELRRGYAPHPLRAAFVAFDDAAVDRGLPSIAESVVKMLESARTAQAATVNEFSPREIVQVELPFFLAMVLREVDSPAGVIEAALRLRHSPEARDFRDWIRRVDEQATTGTATIEGLTRHVQEARRIVGGQPESRSGDAMKVGLSIGPRSLRLLQSVSEVSDATPRFGELLRRVFGAPMADLWGRYRATLSPALTGAVTDPTLRSHPLRRPPLEEARPVGEEAPSVVPATAKQVAFVVADEWFPVHGGLSTFNRRLCAALGSAGVDVHCLVPRASEEEIRDAQENGVRLAVTPSLYGTSGVAAGPGLATEISPTLIVGHGRVTGPHAKALAEGRYPNTARVHLVHVIPDQIEWLKQDRQDDAAARSERRTWEELQYALGASCVAAVGPRIYEWLDRDLKARDGSVELIRLDPGFDDVDRAPRQRPGGAPLILLTGRLEDASIKGLDLAAKAIHRAVELTGGSGSPPELCVRGAPAGHGERLRDKIRDWLYRSLEVTVRNYSVDEIALRHDLLRSSLVLMPSRAEGFGLVGLEAITAGTPALVSDRSGLGTLLKEVLPPDLAGRIVVPVKNDEARDVDLWGHVIASVLRNVDAAFDDAVRVRSVMAAKRTWAQAARQLLTVAARHSS